MHTSLRVFKKNDDQLVNDEFQPFQNEIEPNQRVLEPNHQEPLKKPLAEEASVNRPSTNNSSGQENKPESKSVDDYLKFFI